MKILFGKIASKPSFILSHMLQPGNLYWYCPDAEVPIFVKDPTRVVLRGFSYTMDLRSAAPMSYERLNSCRFLPFEPGENITLEQE